jgi:hypothetical protein
MSRSRETMEGTRPPLTVVIEQQCKSPAHPLRPDPPPPAEFAGAKRQTLHNSSGTHL